ncbi:hypothetical protein HAL_25730 [Haladaptatus sp. T7]|nr:hypothetical protein HAL_25730 [Haladaptatus sp. T7]
MDKPTFDGGAHFRHVPVGDDMRLTVYGPLRSATGEKTVSMAFDGGTVEDALAAFVERYPRAETQLFDDDGSLRTSARISVNGERVEVDDACPADAEVTVFPAVQGGRTDGQGRPTDG